jgi:hypothetical protein
MDNTQPVKVTGRFITDKGPLEGMIWFIPSHPWFWHQGRPFAVIGRHAMLQDGAFQVELTRTDIKGLDFHYDVYCRVGHWKIRITENGPLQMVDLMPKGDRQK